LGVTIRKAALSDVDVVTAIEGVCFPPLEAAGHEAMQKRLAAFHQSFLVAEVDGKIVGFIDGCITAQKTITDDLYHSVAKHDEHGAYQAIFGLAVRPEYQHQRVAAVLMEALIDISRKAGRMGLTLTCKERLIPFYEQFGYVCLGLAKSTHGDAVWYDMVLTL